MTRPGPRTALLAATVATALLGAAPAHAAVTFEIEGIKGKAAKVAQKVAVHGQVDPAGSVPVKVTTEVGVHKPETETVQSNAAGKFSIPIKVDACCTYKIFAETDAQGSGGTSFDVAVPRLHHGSRGGVVAMFHTKLREQGFFVRGKKSWNSTTDLAVLAFRKTNKMARNQRYSRKIFRMLLEGRGAYPLQHPDEGPNGKHVEVDISRQVMTLAEGGVPKHTFHVATGTGGTPTVTGKYSFYLRQPGYNGKRMYYSVYFVGGYATHGYSSVPNGPASHGCVRNPIQFSRFIYNWIELGDPIWVYH